MDAVSKSRKLKAQISGYAADDGVSRAFHCILEHILESNPQVDAAFSRRMNRCPGYRKALEIHIPSFEPLAATAGHDLWSNINDIKNHQNQPIPMVTLDSCVCVCVCVCVCLCVCACVYPEPNSVTETGLGELGLFSTGPCA